MLGTVANSCCTHETPPLIFWNPQSEQVDFHIKRFRMLCDHYPLVADVSHWWLNSIEQVFDQFPETKIIGLIRDHDDCAMSFMRIQGFGEGVLQPMGDAREWLLALWALGPYLSKLLAAQLR